MDVAAFATPLLPLMRPSTRASCTAAHRRAFAPSPLRRPLRMAAGDAESEPAPSAATDIPPASDIGAAVPAPAAPAAAPPTPAAAPPAPDSSISAQKALRLMREDVARENLPRDVKTGVYRDVDGKSNVFAVEPRESVDDKPQLNKAAILAAVFACVALALLVLPRLPFTNADQF